MKNTKNIFLDKKNFYYKRIFFSFKKLLSKKLKKKMNQKNFQLEAN